MTPITVSIRVVAHTPDTASVYRPTGGPLGGVDVPFVDPPTLPNIDPESVADGVAVGVTVAVDVAVAVAVGTTVAVDVGYSQTRRRQDELDMRIRTNDRVLYEIDTRGVEIGHGVRRERDRPAAPWSAPRPGRSSRCGSAAPASRVLPSP